MITGLHPQFNRPKTVSGWHRRSLRDWWAMHGSPAEYVAIYNDGMHLYVGYVRPGQYIPDSRFRFMRYSESLIKVGNITIVHRGHSVGQQGGMATVMVMSGNEINPRVTVWPNYMAYVILMQYGFQVKFSFVPPNMVRSDVS